MPMRYHELTEYGPASGAEMSIEQEVASLGEDALFEMANLVPEQTGMPDGIIYISTALGVKHGPWVKFFMKAGSGFSFSVSIDDNPAVKTCSKGFERAKALYADQVIEFVRLNKAVLLDFWFHGNTWTDPQVTAMKSSLRPIH